MSTFLKRIFAALLLLGILVAAALYYLGILDWGSTKTQLRVQSSTIVAEAKQVVDSGIGGATGGGGKSALEGAPQCRANLEKIQRAKRAAAGKSASEVGGIAWAPVLKELGGKRPVCPSGGVYTLGDLQSNPKCSIGAAGTIDKKSAHMLVNY